MGLHPSSEIRHPLTRHRLAVATMTRMSAQIPQYPLFLDIDLEAVQRLRNTKHERPSIADIMAVAAARLLRSYPNVNSSFADDAVIEYREIHVGLALDLPGGLIVLVVRDADRRSVADFRSERNRLQAAAADGGLRAQDIAGATFVISNLGPMGIHAFQAMLVPPAAAILAVGAIREVARAKDGVLAASSGLTLCLTSDHRVIDGAEAARFLRGLGDILEGDESLSALFAS